MKTKLNSKDICCVLLFMLAPVTPEYCALFGHPLQTYLLAVAFLLTIVSFVASNKLRIKKDSITITVLLYAVIIATVNLISGKSIIVCLFLVVKFISPIIVTLYLVKTKEDMEKAVNYILIASVFVIILSFLELLNFNIFSLIENADLKGMGTRAQTRMGLLRLEGPFGQAIPYAIYITFISGLVQYRIITTKRRIYSVYLVLIWIAEFLTMSRAPIVIFLLIQLAFFLFNNTSQRIKTLGKVLVGVLLGVLLLVVLGIDVQGIWNKITTLFISLTSNSVSSELDFGDNYNPYIYRFALVERVIENMKNNNISFLFGDYYWENSFSIDNGYLALLIFNGFAGLFGRLLLYIFSLVESFKMYFRMRKKDYLPLKLFPYIMIAMILGYLLNLTSVAQMGEATIFLIIIGLALSNVRIYRRYER